MDVYYGGKHTRFFNEITVAIILLACFSNPIRSQCSWDSNTEPAPACKCAINFLQELSVECKKVRFTKLQKDLKGLEANTTVNMLYVEDSNIMELREDSFPNNIFLRIGLSKSRIQFLHPDAFRGQERYLQTLNLENNDLTDELFVAIKTLRSLINLDLSNNNITKLNDDSFMGLKLEMLKMEGNKLILGPNAFRGLENSLKTLNLRSTNQQGLPECLRKLRALTTLDLSRNNLQDIQIPRYFANFDSLVNLYLDRNEIRYINSDAFVGLSDTLISLRLTNNKLTHYPMSAIRILRSLSVLDVGGNLLKEFPDEAFIGNHLLQTLALDGNPLRTLSLSTVQHLNATLKGLAFGGKSFNCDCHVQWIAHWMTKYNLKVSSRQTNPEFCGYPPKLKPKNFDSIKEDELVCKVESTTQEPDFVMDSTTLHKNISATGNANTQGDIRAPSSHEYMSQYLSFPIAMNLTTTIPTTPATTIKSTNETTTPKIAPQTISEKNAAPTNKLIPTTYGATISMNPKAVTITTPVTTIIPEFQNVANLTISTKKTTIPKITQTISEKNVVLSDKLIPTTSRATISTMNPTAMTTTTSTIPELKNVDLTISTNETATQKITSQTISEKNTLTNKLIPTSEVIITTNATFGAKQSTIIPSKEATNILSTRISSTATSPPVEDSATTLTPQNVAHQLTQIALTTVPEPTLRNTRTQKTTGVINSFTTTATTARSMQTNGNASLRTLKSETETKVTAAICRPKSDSFNSESLAEKTIESTATETSKVEVAQTDCIFYTKYKMKTPKNISEQTHEFNLVTTPMASTERLSNVISNETTPLQAVFTTQNVLNPEMISSVISKSRTSVPVEKTTLKFHLTTRNKNLILTRQASKSIASEHNITTAMSGTLGDTEATMVSINNATIPTVPKATFAAKTDANEQQISTDLPTISLAEGVKYTHIQTMSQKPSTNTDQTSLRAPQRLEPSTGLAEVETPKWQTINPTKSENQDNILKNVYRNGNSIIIQWDYNMVNSSGFRIAHRLFGNDNHWQIRQVEAGVQKYKIENVTHEDGVTVCVIAPDNVALPDFFPNMRCIDVHPSTTDINTKKFIVIGAVAATGVVLAIILAVAITNNRKKPGQQHRLKHERRFDPGNYGFQTNSRNNHSQEEPLNTLHKEMHDSKNGTRHPGKNKDSTIFLELPNPDANNIQSTPTKFDTRKEYTQNFKFPPKTTSSRNDFQRPLAPASISRGRKARRQPYFMPQRDN